MSSNKVHDHALGVCGRLREERIKTGLDQKDFAELVGIKPRTYMTYENKVPIPSDKLSLIAEKSDVDVLRIISGTTNRTGEQSRSDDLIGQMGKLRQAIKRFFEESLILNWVVIPRNVDEEKVFEFFESCLSKELGLPDGVSRNTNSSQSKIKDSV